LCLPRFWDTRNSRNTATVTTPSANLYIAWSPDSHHVAVASRDDVVSIIDAR
jgi:WD40 repeat protein